MLVRPSAAAGADKVLEETRVLFQTKEVYLVVAEIGDFLQECRTVLDAFRAGNDKFWHDFNDVKNQLTELTKEITK